MLISPADAEAIERLLRKIQLINEEGTETAPGPDDDCLPRTELIARAETIFRERRRRSRFFNRSMFAEPAWDMVLAVYIMQGHPVNIATLVSMVDVPQTTALRWLQYLEKERFVRREPDPDDRRQVSVRLLNHGFARIEAYLRSMSAEIGSSQ
jgi:DNA-binding MarR family transcriptional regulator